MASLLRATQGDLCSRQTIAAIVVDMLDVSAESGTVPCRDALWTGLGVIAVVPDQDINATYLRSTHQDILRAIMKLLTSEPSAEQINLATTEHTLVAKGCNCDRSNHFVHDLHFPERLPQGSLYQWPSLWYGNASRLQVTLSPAIVTLNYVLQSIAGVGMRSLLKAARLTAYPSKRRRWPSSLHDLVPRGPQVSIINMCAWAPHLCHIQFLLCVNNVYDLIAIPAVPRVLFSHIVPFALCPIFRQTLLQWRHDKHWPVEGIPVLQCYSEILESLSRHFADPQLLAFLHRTVDFNWELLHELCMLGLQASGKLNRAHANQYNAQQEKREDRVFTVLAARLYLAFGSLWKKREPPAFLWDWEAPMEAEILEDVRHHDHQTVTDPFYAFSTFVYRSLLCGSPECGRSEVSENRKLSVCTACRHVFYCSRKCQREAWHHPDAPHRGICANIGAIMEDLESPSEEKLQYSARLDSENRDTFVQACLAAGVTEHSASELANHFVTMYSRGSL